MFAGRVFSVVQNSVMKEHTLSEYFVLLFSKYFLQVFCTSLTAVPFCDFYYPQRLFTCTFSDALCHFV